MGNLLSLWTWGFGSLGGIVNGRDDDACLDITPSGVRSAITQSSCDDLHLVRVNLSSLWKAGYVPVRRVFNGRDGDACLDRTPLGVRSAITGSSSNGGYGDACLDRTPGGVRSAITRSSSNDYGVVEDGNVLNEFNSKDGPVNVSNKKTFNVDKAEEFKEDAVVISIAGPDNDVDYGAVSTLIDSACYSCRNSAIDASHDYDIEAFNNFQNSVLCGVLYASSNRVDEFMNKSPVNTTKESVLTNVIGSINDCVDSINVCAHDTNGSIFDESRNHTICAYNKSGFVDAYNNSGFVDDGASFSNGNRKRTASPYSIFDVSNQQSAINDIFDCGLISRFNLSQSKSHSNYGNAQVYATSTVVTEKNDGKPHSSKSRAKKKFLDDEPSNNGKYCHTFSSNTTSSQRTRAAASAYLYKSNCISKNRITRKRNNKRRHLKEIKHAERLVRLESTEERKKIGKKYSIPFLKENVVVFDGGKESATAPTFNSDVQGWYCQKIKDGHLEICSPPSGDKGLIYQDEYDQHPRFILLPRKDSININSNGNELCKAMIKVSKYKNKLVRGKSKTVFGEYKYCCVGAQPRRNAPGVEPGHYNLNGVSREDWDCIVKAVRRSEHAFYGYASTDTIRHINEARDVVSWERIKYSDEKEEKEASIFNGIAFGVNVYLRAHIDNDFTYSVIQVHTVGEDYKIDDDIVCYFCFPRLGIAVALKPGDFLLINALEYHCLSSRRCSEVDLFCVSSYLKTAVVGGNDNKRKLSEREMACLNTVPNKKGRK